MESSLFVFYLQIQHPWIVLVQTYVRNSIIVSSKEHSIIIIWRTNVALSHFFLWNTRIMHTQYAAFVCFTLCLHCWYQSCDRGKTFCVHVCCTSRANQGGHLRVRGTKTLLHQHVLVKKTRICSFCCCRNGKGVAVKDEDQTQTLKVTVAVLNWCVF
jgi:hypothetical protein